MDKILVPINYKQLKKYINKKKTLIPSKVTFHHVHMWDFAIKSNSFPKSPKNKFSKFKLGSAYNLKTKKHKLGKN